MRSCCGPIPSAAAATASALGTMPATGVRLGSGGAELEGLLVLIGCGDGRLQLLQAAKGSTLDARGAHAALCDTYCILRRPPIDTASLKR